jgi:hypothetical protein
MSDHLQPPRNQLLGKRQSEEDLGKARVEEKKASKEEEDRRKEHWVRKELTSRVRREYYCCYCDKRRDFAKDTPCRTCGHRSWRCSECLAGRV